MEYKGILPERKLWVKVAGIIVAIVVIFLSVMAHQWLYISISVVVVLACLFSKEHVVDEDGIDIRYHLLGMVFNNYWGWNEISEMQTDPRKARPNVMVHFGKGMTIRTFVMAAKDVEPVIALAAKQNPDILIDHMTKEEQEERDRRVLHQQEVERAKRNAAKRRK